MKYSRDTRVRWALIRLYRHLSRSVTAFSDVIETHDSPATGLKFPKVVRTFQAEMTPEGTVSVKILEICSEN